MLADYWDVVPRREFEMLETSCHVSLADENNTIVHNAIILEHGV